MNFQWRVANTGPSAVVNVRLGEILCRLAGRCNLGAVRVISSCELLGNYCPLWPKRITKTASGNPSLPARSNPIRAAVCNWALASRLAQLSNVPMSNRSKRWHLGSDQRCWRDPSGAPEGVVPQMVSVGPTVGCSTDHGGQLVGREGIFRGWSTFRVWHKDCRDEHIPALLRSVRFRRHS